MNRSFINVILGGFGGEAAAVTAGTASSAGQERQRRRRGLHAVERRQRGDRAGLWPRGRPCAARREGTGAELIAQGRRRLVSIHPVTAVCRAT